MKSRKKRRASRAASNGWATNTADDLLQGVQPVLEPRGDAEVAAAAAECPEEVGIGLGCHAEHVSRRSHQLDGQQVVDGEAVHATQPAEPAAEREPGDAGRRNDPTGRGEPVEGGLSVQLTPRDSTLGAHGLRSGVDMNALHLSEVDHHAAVCDSLPRHAVSAAAHGDLEPSLACQRNRVDDVGRAATPCDQRRPLVDETVVNPSRFLVASGSGLQQRTRELRGQ